MQFIIRIRPQKFQWNFLRNLRPKKIPILLPPPFTTFKGFDWSGPSVYFLFCDLEVSLAVRMMFLIHRCRKVRRRNPMMNYLPQVAQRNHRNQKSLMIAMKVWTKTIKKRDNRHQRSLPYCRTRYTCFISKM